MSLLQRIERDSHTVPGRGFRVILPLFVWLGRGYDIIMDRQHYGWWAWSFALSVERLGYPGEFVGLRTTLAWGHAPIGHNRKAAA